MIALDTSALIRLLIEDDVEQAKIVQDLVEQIEADDGRILILSEVLIESVWVLESVYDCSRAEIVEFFEALLNTSVFTAQNPTVLRTAVSEYKKGGDFADLIIVNLARHYKAEKLISFDKKLQKRFSGYVIGERPGG